MPPVTSVRVAVVHLAPSLALSSVPFFSPPRVCVHHFSATPCLRQEPYWRHWMHAEGPGHGSWDAATGLQNNDRRGLGMQSFEFPVFSFWFTVPGCETRAPVLKECSCRFHITLVDDEHRLEMMQMFVRLALQSCCSPPRAPHPKHLFQNPYEP